MEFMEKITKLSKKVGDAASDTYSVVADKSGKLIEETKLKIEISDKQSEIKKIYEEMGKAVYDLYKKGEEVGSAFTKEAKKIDKLLKEIDENDKKILECKGLQKCDKCGETIVLKSNFCEACGAKQKVVRTKKVAKEQEEVELEKTCKKCKTVCDGRAKFCPKCGEELTK